MSELTLVSSNSTVRAADARAARNWAANLRALAATQPRLIQQIQSLEAPVQWMFARDGYLSARKDNVWWSGCSAPLQAAQYMMRTLEAGGSMACLLAPAHAAQVRVVVDRLQRPQGMIVLQPDEQALRILLACDDFSAAIAAHRLWFAWGATWEAELAQLLEEQSGLPMPSQFVRPIAAEYGRADGLIAPAQKIFAEVGARRQTAVREIVQSGKRPTREFCVIAPSQFRLWDDAGTQLAEALVSMVGQAFFDPDDPASASPLALANAASECEAVVAANTGRADLPNLVAHEKPWISWLTSPRIPRSQGRGPNDALLIADESFRQLALSEGWPAEKILMADWPQAPVGSTEPSIERGAFAFIANLPSIQPPAKVLDYSSHVLLWDSLTQELLSDPFSLGNIAAFLGERMRRLEISAEGFDRALFIDGVIVPSYQRGLARLMLHNGLTLHCHGTGWSDSEEFAAVAAGPVESREALMEAARNVRALVHCWPTEHRHPIESIGRPVIRAYGKQRPAFLHEARLLAAGKARMAEPTHASPLRTAILQAFAASKSRAAL